LFGVVTSLSSGAYFKDGQGAGGSEKQSSERTEKKAPCLSTNGVLTTLEFFANHKDTQQMTISQIASFSQFTLDSITCSHSIVFGSSCGERVAHLVGWQTNGPALEKNLHSFREAGNNKDNGMPVALKESSHLYKCVYSVPKAETRTMFELGSGNVMHPLFSLDIYNCFSPNVQKEVVSLLTAAVSTAKDATLPDLNAMHVLQSLDSLTVVVVGVWNSFEGQCTLAQVPSYQTIIQKVKKLSNAGTYSDLLHKKNPDDRIYLVAATHIPK